MKQDNSLYWCGLEAFINLYAYDVIIILIYLVWIFLCCFS